MMPEAAPAPTSLKLSRSSCETTHAGMYRGDATPSSSHVTSSPCLGRVFVSIDTSTRRFLCSMGGGPAGASHSVSCDNDGFRSSCVSGGGVLRSLMSPSVVWCLVPESIVISLRSCGE
jgi:hypothetical protein